MTRTVISGRGAVPIRRQAANPGPLWRGHTGPPPGQP